MRKPEDLHETGLSRQRVIGISDEADKIFILVQKKRAAAYLPQSVFL